MHRLLYLLLIPLGICFYVNLSKRNTHAVVEQLANVSKKRAIPFSRLKERKAALANYTKTNSLNSSYAFVVDMKEHSGNQRFYVYDLVKDTVLSAGLVTHGYGNNSQQAVQFSNVLGSNCTSLGHYKIGNAYYGRFGLAFKLHGQDKTNSNAINRFVVLHSHPCVPDSATYPYTICMSQGCPTVSPAYLQTFKHNSYR